jgi:hypothetical protein
MNCFFKAQNWPVMIMKATPLLFSMTTLFLILPQSGVCQQVIVHQRFITNEDGNPKYDADADTNKVVLWQGGAVHVVDGGYLIGRGYTLKVLPGAIVKIAGTFVVDTLGVLIRWVPPSSSGLTVQDWWPHPGYPPLDSLGVIQIEGATITDIRDDFEGGNTTQGKPPSEGSSQLPATWIDLGIDIELMGNSRSYIKGSKLKYVRQIAFPGSANITGNEFFMFGTIVDDAGTDPTRRVGAITVIRDNVFHLASIDHEAIFFRLVTPIIENNYFRYDQRVVPEPVYDKAIVINESSIDTPGNTEFVISGNLFETISGIELYGTKLRGKIHNNIIREYRNPLKTPQAWECSSMSAPRYQ